MALNPYFNFITPDNEQTLIKDLHRESIQIHGQMFNYIQRDNFKEDYLFGEDVQSSFQTYFDIEGYIISYETYGGQRDLITSFGLAISDEIEIQFSQEAFREITGMDYPKEGDLIYFKTGKALFEISHNEDENMFYPLGTQVDFVVKCLLYKYNQNDISTGIDEIDSIQDMFDPSVGGLDPFANNEEIEIEADTILDQTESSPFGNY